MNKKMIDSTKFVMVPPTAKATPNQIPANAVINDTVEKGSKIFITIMVIPIHITTYIYKFVKDSKKQEFYLKEFIKFSD